MTVRRGVALLAAVVVVGCGGSSTGHTTGSVSVLAASSLTDAFSAIATAYEKQTGTRVRLSFGGSQDLARQIDEGAPADVIATADPTTMHSVGNHLRGSSRVFARNTLVIVVAPGNPKHVQRLADLTHVSVVLADPSVPAGRYAAAALSAAHVSVRPRSLELEVRAVLTKVELGEADAGIVYATDARSAGSQVDAIPLPDGPIAVYPIGALSEGGSGFRDFVLSPDGQALLRRFGFLPP